MHANTGMYVCMHVFVYTYIHICSNCLCITKQYIIYIYEHICMDRYTVYVFADVLFACFPERRASEDLDA